MFIYAPSLNPPLLPPVLYSLYQNLLHTVLVLSLTSTTHTTYSYIHPSLMPPLPLPVVYSLLLPPPCPIFPPPSSTWTTHTTCSYPGDMPLASCWGNPPDKPSYGFMTSCQPALCRPRACLTYRCVLPPPPSPRSYYPLFSLSHLTLLSLSPPVF